MCITALLSSGFPAMGLCRNPSESMYCSRLSMYGTTEGIFFVTHVPKSTTFMIVMRFSLLMRLSDDNITENQLCPRCEIIRICHQDTSVPVVTIRIFVGERGYRPASDYNGTFVLRNILSCSLKRWAQIRLRFIRVRVSRWCGCYHAEIVTRRDVRSRSPRLKIFLRETAEEFYIPVQRCHRYNLSLRIFKGVVGKFYIPARGMNYYYGSKRTAENCSDAESAKCFP